MRRVDLDAGRRLPALRAIWVIGAANREVLDPGAIVRGRSWRADPVAAAGLHEDLLPVRFLVESARIGKAVVARQIGQLVLG